MLNEYIYAAISGLLMASSDAVQKYTYDRDFNYITHLALSYGVVYLFILSIFIGLLFLFNYNQQILNIKKLSDILNIEYSDYKYIFIVSFLSFFALVCSLMAFKKCKILPYVIVILSGSINLASILIGYFIFKNKINIYGGLGMLLILLGCYLIIIYGY